MTEIQKHQEKATSKVEWTENPTTKIQDWAKKISRTEGWGKVWKEIKVKIWTKEVEKSENNLNNILRNKKWNEKVSEKNWSNEVLKNLDSKIEKTLPDGQDMDKLAKVVRNKKWEKFDNLEDAKTFLREQFLKWEIKNLNELVANTYDKEWNKKEISKYDSIIAENPELEKVLSWLENEKLAKEVLSIYWKKELEGYSNLLDNIKWEALPKNIEDFNELLTEEAIKRVEEAWKGKIDKDWNSVDKWMTDKEYKKYVKDMISDPKTSWAMISQMSKKQWISETQAKNVKSQPLPSNFESLSWEQKTLALIKHFEWFSPKSYWDYKQWSYWYWSKSPWKWTTITESEASSLLENKIKSNYNIEIELNKRWMSDVYKKLGNNQKAALSSFIYNLWPAKLDNLKTVLESGNSQAVSSEMLQYNKAWWNILKGLVSRRKTEANLFLKEDLNNKKESKEINA